MTTLMTASVAHRPEDPERPHVETVYDPRRQAGKIVAFGTVAESEL